MNSTKPLTLANLDRSHPIKRSLRRIARTWPLAYSKLLCLEWHWSTDCDFGATDGVRILLNPDGVDQLYLDNGVGGAAFLLLHEACHAILNHGVRLAKLKDREVAAIAADYKVNEMVGLRSLELRGGDPSAPDLFPMPEGVLYEPAWSEPYSTEQLYQLLLKDKQSNPQPQPQYVISRLQSGSSPTPNSPTPHTGSDNPAGGSPSDDPHSRVVEASGVGSTGGSDGGSTLLSPPAPASPDPGAQNPEPSGGGQSPASGTPPHCANPNIVGGGGVDTFKPEVGKGETEQEVKDRIEEQNERLMTQASLEDTQHCGSDSATTERIGRERQVHRPQDWAEYAKQFVETRCSNGWLAPYNHAVYTATGLCAPGQEGKKVGDIIVVSDSSGSIGEEAWQKFFELNQYILDDIRPERLLLISCAEDVKDHVVLEHGDTVPTTLNGGGGTSFKKAFDWVDEDPHNLCIDPLLLIYFTDGWCSDHLKMTEPPYPVLWLSYQRGKHNFPWGEYQKITLS